MGENLMGEKVRAKKVKGEIALVGGGVIGAGWAARFLINGYDVALYDPSPDVERTCKLVSENAERAMARLTMVTLPARGRLRVTAKIEEALEKAIWVQESVPEREELKKNVLRKIANQVDDSVTIASSTSGLLPTKLQEGLRAPERFLVAHPFNPVYLLPLVELVGGEKTAKQTLAAAKQFYQSFGMKAVVVRKEIDAFIADRLLESVWREALWLIQDGVASTEEIDDVIKFGFGLRWAQMGLFETYRIAGGDGGFRHFLAQFAPTLKLPWSRLVDVPEWSEQLEKTIVEQSDAQARGRSSLQLERIRDDNLAAILNALKAQAWGAGETLLEYERILSKRVLGQTLSNDSESKVTAPSDIAQSPQPLRLLRTRVAESWLDVNGHMNESRYLQVFSNATDMFLVALGFDDAAFARGFSFYTLETNLRHLCEAKAGQKICVATRLLGCDAKRLHLLHGMYLADSSGGGGLLLATAEHILLHVMRGDDGGGGARSAPMGDMLAGNFRSLLVRHSELPLPDFTLRLGLARDR